MDAQDEPSTEPTTSLEERIAVLESKCSDLEKKSVQSGRALFLSVVAIYAVLVALLILHWAGHVMRHGP